MVALRAADNNNNDVMVQSLIQASARNDVNHVNVDLCFCLLVNGVLQKACS